MAVTAAVIDEMPGYTSYQVVLGADTDAWTVDVEDVETFSVRSSGITADAVKVEVALLSTGTAFDQLLDDTDTNPFDAGNGLYEVEKNAFKRLRLTRDGAADGDITMLVGLSSER